MGTRAAPTFASLFMGKKDKMIQKAAVFGTTNLVMFHKRFIDDILLICVELRSKYSNFWTQLTASIPQ